MTPESFTEIIEYDRDKLFGKYGIVTLPFDAIIGSAQYDFGPTLMNMGILSFSLQTNGVNDGDTIRFIVNPEAPTGMNLNGDVAIAQTVIDVPSTFTAALDDPLNSLSKGLELILDDGTNKQNMGIILSYDSIANTVTVSKAATTAFTATSPTTALKVSATMSPGVIAGFEEIEIAASDVIFNAGEDKIGSTFVPAGATLRFVYDNKGTAVVRIRPTVKFII